MSVLFKSPSSSGGSIGGGSSKGFPPGDVIIVDKKIQNMNQLYIKIQDPEDTILDGALISKWKNTIIVHNSNHIPTSIKDGTVVLDNNVKNKYKDAYFIQTDLPFGKNYWRIYTCSEDKVYNDSTSMIIMYDVLEVYPKFSDNSWDQIINACNNGSVPSTWKVGDTKDMKLEGELNQTQTFQIWDFNHFDKSDGSGKAAICFGMKDVLEDFRSPMHQAQGNWVESKMRTDIMPRIFNCIPINIRNNIKQVKIQQTTGDNGFSISTAEDKIFLSGATETGYLDEYTNVGAAEKPYQKKFRIFTDDNSRKKSTPLHLVQGEYVNWWTRSGAYTTPSYYRGNFFEIQPTGKGYLASHDTPTANFYFNNICFCFNI